MRAGVVLLAAALSMSAQDSRQQVAQVRAHMVETLAQQPNYTCLETIERATRAPREKSFRILDVIKLEVALVGGKEMFAWPGSRQFEDADIRHFVPAGMFGYGDFGLYTKEVFEGTSTAVQLQGETELDQRTVTRYDFSVPAANGIRISAGQKIAQASYHGSFYAEPGTMDLVQLDVIADPLPASLDLREVTDTMKYARARIGAGEFLLPSAADAVITDKKGDSSRNRIQFTSCREFTGESTLKFDDSAADTLAAPAAKQEIKLPANLVLILRLVDEIDIDKAAVGDVVRAALSEDVKHKGQALLAKGTPVSGRIIRLERMSNFTVLGLMFDQAESATAHADLNLTFDMAMGTALLARGTRWGTTSPIRLHEGLVPLPAGHVRAGRGIILFWRT